MKPLFSILVLLVLVLGLNNWIIEPESQINDKGFFLKTLRDQSKFKYTSIQEPKSSLFNNASWVDSPVDDDGNGLYDYLVISNISLTSITQSMYLLGVLKGNNGQCLGIEKITIAPSDNNISLFFNGQPINASGSDGYYEVWVSVSTNYAYQGFNLTLMYITSQAYNANEFEEASAIIIGFSDEGYDTDGDNLFNEITIEVTIQVRQEDYYYLRLVLESSNIFVEDQNFSVDWHGHLSIGIETVRVNITTSNFYATKLNGPYSVNLAYIAYIVWDFHINHHFLTDMYTTRIYNYTDFDPPAVFLTGTYGDRGDDTDGDGKFNQLVIDVEINVTLAGSYYVNLELSSTKNDITLWEGSEEDYDVGIHVVSISFDLEIILLYSHQLNTSYNVNSIQLIQDGNLITEVYSPYTTRIYNYTEFDPPVAFLTGTYSDRGVDTDGDGKFNQLVFDVEINVTYSGLYNLYIELSSKDGKNYNQELYMDHWEDGLRNISFSFDIDNINFGLYQNTSFVIDYICIRTPPPSYNEINWRFDAYETRLYNYTEFDPPTAFLTGTYSDQGVDTDGDGRFDELIINIEINFTKEARYKIEIVLRDMYSETSITKVKRSDWTEGTRNISFSIDAYALYPSIPRGTLYVLEFMTVYDSNNNLISQSHQNSTLNYYYTDFDIHQITIDGNNDFNMLIRDENWPGNGTFPNPYIIEELSMNGPKSIDLISIRNTMVYFNITNCSLNGGAAGINLYNVENAHISNNLIQNNNEGIYLRFSDNNVITGNTITTTNNGIRLGSNNLNFPNTVNNNTIINNVFYNNSHSGVWCAYESRGNLIKWNDFKDNGQPTDSQAMDNGLNNSFSSNHWYNWTSNEPYLIIGYPGTVDSNPLNYPHHLSKPTINFPNGGETLTADIVIDWTPSKDDLGHDITYSIYFSSDNGSTWILLGTNFLIASFRWDTRYVPLGSSFLVRVIALDSFGFFVMDTSDQPFTIQGPSPSSTLLFRLVLFLLICSLLVILIKKKAK